MNTNAQESITNDPVSQKDMANAIRFNAAGQAPKITVIPLSKMAQRYDANELEPQIENTTVAAA